MAPEQAAGRVAEIGPAVDVYALGAILYELLTGQPPFRADSWYETVEQVLRDEPAPPTRLQADVPLALETVCLKRLEKDLGRRYASAKDLAADLDRFLAGQPVAAVALSPRDRLGRLAARDGYQIIDEVGRGPGTVVYRGLYGPLQQPVALKVYVEATLTREEWETRFRRAADFRAALVHPHIIPVQRAGWWDGAPYLAMEYAPHGGLAAKRTGRRHSIPEVLRLVAQMAEIVNYAHRQGIVHGNLKPSNVLLRCRRHPSARRLSREAAVVYLWEPRRPWTTRKAWGLAIWRPGWSGPRTRRLHPSTDIYGLGLILLRNAHWPAAVCRLGRERNRGKGASPADGRAASGSINSAQLRPPLEAISSAVNA